MHMLSFLHKGRERGGEASRLVNVGVVGPERTQLLKPSDVA